MTNLTDDEAPSVILSQQEHIVINNLLNKQLPTGQRYTRQAVWDAYQRVYSEVPEMANHHQTVFRG